MKQKRFTAIFVVMTAINNNNLCMEPQEKDLKQLLKADGDYKELENILKKKIVDNYNTIHPAQQYEMLKTCIDNKNMQCLKICLTHEFNPNRYHKGLSLLHYAIQKNNCTALQLLADANPDLVPLNNLEETPLIYAARLQYFECMDVMSHIIKTKYNDLRLNKKHCGLTKHILRSERPCYKCLEELSFQLLWCGLDYVLYNASSDSYSSTSYEDYYSPATDTDSSNADADSR